MQRCQDKTGIQSFTEDEWQHTCERLLGTDTPERQTTLLVLGSGAMNVYQESWERLEKHLAIVPMDNEAEDFGCLDNVRTQNVVLLCCLGGGHSRLIPEVVERLQTAGKRVFSVCAMPLDFEGKERIQLAQETLRFLGEHGVKGKVFHNQFVMDAYGELSVSEAMGKANKIMADYVLEMVDKYEGGKDWRG